MGTFRITQNVFKPFEQLLEFPDNLAGFQTGLKTSKLSGMFRDNLESLQTIWKIDK